MNKKRRIYDITNVLEGINLIRKVGKNVYAWTGEILFRLIRKYVNFPLSGKKNDAAEEEEDRINDLKDQTLMLKDQEEELDQ